MMYYFPYMILLGLVFFLVVASGHYVDSNGYEQQQETSDEQHDTSDEPDASDEQLTYASDVDLSQCATTKRTKKKGHGHKVNHSSHHPIIGCTFNILWDDDTLVYDEMTVNLNHKMYILAIDYLLFGMIKNKNTSMMP